MEFRIIIILHYMSKKRSNVGIGIKSTPLKICVEEWNGHNTFAHPLKFDELLH